MTLQQDYAWGPTIVLGGVRFLESEAPLYRSPSGPVDAEVGPSEAGGVGVRALPVPLLPVERESFVGCKRFDKSGDGYVYYVRPRPETKRLSSECSHLMPTIDLKKSTKMEYQGGGALYRDTRF